MALISRLSLRVVVVAFVFIAVVTVFAIASTAFTNAQLSRDASIDVVTDDTSIISLETGPSNATGSIVTYDADGRLSIDFTVGAATGVNPYANYTLGSTSSPTTTYAFRVVNYDGAAHDIELAYSMTSDPDALNANVKFRLYDSAGSFLGSVDEDTSYTATAVPASGGSVYVVLIVDSSGIGSSADLSGTLTVTAT